MMRIFYAIGSLAASVVSIINALAGHSTAAGVWVCAALLFIVVGVRS